MDPADWFLVVLTAGSSAAVLSVKIRKFRARKHLRMVDTRIACPRTACGVACTLVRDERSGSYVLVRRCSGVESGPHGAGCDQDCLTWLNLGIPLTEG